MYNGVVLNSPADIIWGNYVLGIFFLSNTKVYNHLIYISLKIAHFCNYTFLPATLNLLDSFMEANFGKPFQLFVAFLIMSIASQTYRPTNADFSQEKI